MEKENLIAARKKRGLSQEDIAIMMPMDTTTYGRKENGILKITAQEWKKLSRILDVPLKDIYEEDEKSHTIIGDNNVLESYSGDHNYCNIPEFVLETMKKYIAKLELEIESVTQQSSEK